jgi:hypothetical protein
MTRHYTCAQLLEEAHTLMVRLAENDAEAHIDLRLWLDRYHDWETEQRLGESD